MSNDKFPDNVCIEDLSLHGFMDDFNRMRDEHFKKLGGEKIRHTGKSYFKRIDPEKQANEDLYRGLRIVSQSPGSVSPVVQLNKRIRELFGVTEGEEIKIRAMYCSRDPRLAEILIQDALRTGHRDQLPDELIPEYDRQVTNSL